MVLIPVVNRLNRKKVEIITLIRASLPNSANGSFQAANLM